MNISQIVFLITNFYKMLYLVSQIQNLIIGIAKKLHMLVTKYSYTISFYQEACENSDYNLLSKSSLWRILASIKPSERKHLGGFDNLTASGINRFGHFSNCPLNIELKKQRLKLFKMGKDTLKQITKCTATLSATLSLRHILLFALSDPNNTCLRANSETSNNSSDDFRKLIEAIYKIQSIIKYNENLDAVCIVILP